MKHIYTRSLCVLILCILLNGCAIVNQDPNIKTYQQRHKTIAILPYNVSLEKAKLPKGMGLEQRKQLEVLEGKILQEQLYNYIQKHNREKKKKLATNFQSILVTDSLLKLAGVTPYNIHEYNHQQVAKILGVDALLNVSVSKTCIMSDLAATVIMILTPISVANKELTVVAILTDGTSNQIVWSVDDYMAGGVLISDHDMIVATEKMIVKRFPYKSK